MSHVNTMTDFYHAPVCSGASPVLAISYVRFFLFHKRLVLAKYPFFAHYKEMKRGYPVINSAAYANDNANIPLVFECNVNWTACN